MFGSRRVGARGDPKSPLVIILEAPGSEELKYGAPICGPSGDLLDKCVPDWFDFDDAYIINAMQCRPPKTANQQRDKEYKARACSACRQRVLGQIFSHPRKCVLALGAWSNSVLTMDYNYKITQRRGEVYAISDPETGAEVTVVPSVHPAYLLRGSGNPKVFRDDLSLAIDLAFGKEITVRDHLWEDPDNVVLERLEDFVKYAKKVRKLAPVEVAADIETSGFNYLTDRILCIGFYIRDKGDCAAIVPGRSLDGAYRHYLRRFLLSAGLRFVWQFGKFDEKFLTQAGILRKGECANYEDTGLESYALSEATKDHDLDEQAKNDLGIPEHKHMLKKWAPKKSDSYANVPEPVLFDYLAKDLKKTYLVHRHKRPLIAADPKLELLYSKTLIPASHLLAGIEMYGIHIDWDYVRINRSGATPDDVAKGLVTSLESEIGLEQELVQIEEQLTKLVGYKINPNSPGEVAALLYDGYGLRIKGKRPTDTRKETLDKLPAHPAVKLIRKYRSVTKMLSTYVAAIEKLAVGDRIHTTFKLHVTPTGRLSSSEPNIQNIPREPRFRRMYRARPGSVLIEGDYNMAELRMLGALSQDEFLTSVFLDGKRNLHDEVSVAMYGPNFDMHQRIRAKAINFGIPYGREAFSVAEEHDIPGQEAQRLIDAWFARAPGAAKFIANCRRAPREGRTLVTVFGRKRRPGVVGAERLKGIQNEFANFHMQSPVSDFTIHSGMEMAPKLKKEGAYLVNLIHDSTLTECPADSHNRIQQVSGIIKETMEEVPTKWISTPIKFVVDVKIGTHWGLATSYDKWLKLHSSQL